MKRIAFAVAAAAAAGTLLTATSAVAAPSQGSRSTTPFTAGAHRSAPSAAKAVGAVSPATYNNACGSGYSVIDTLTLTGGHVYLTYNGSNGYNCVVTVRNTAGTAEFMAAGIRLAGNDASEVVDADDYTSYAGPVYLHAAGKCIDWIGQIASAAQEQDDSHCG